MNGVIALPGFTVKTMTTSPGKGEDSVGTVKVVLVAEKDDVITDVQHPAGRALDIADTVGCVNRHQSDQEAVALRFRFGENTILPVVGFQIKTMTTTASKGEGEHGQVKLVLEAEKDALRASDNDITSIIGAISMYQSTGETTELQLRFT